MRLPRILSRRHPRRPPSAFIVVLLLLTLVLAGLLAQQAYTAARSHRQVAERTLRDYAAFAAWKFSGVIKSELNWIFGMALYPLHETNADADPHALPTPSAFVIPPEKSSTFRLASSSPTSAWICGTGRSPRAEATCPATYAHGSRTPSRRTRARCSGRTGSWLR